jgi:hypothetical protein
MATSGWQLLGGLLGEVLDTVLCTTNEDQGSSASEKRGTSNWAEKYGHNDQVDKIFQYGSSLKQYNEMCKENPDYVGTPYMNRLEDELKKEERLLVRDQGVSKEAIEAIKKRFE